ncbi:hypothetical protein EDB84DRAFT_1439026 [Lactarius hengduanensis]|nr:hypothetical protein EDB84DRAFT_1439026 [Lactarius hengduanensis]
MSSLLEIACRVEAAMDAYGSVKEHTDKELWKKQLEHEKDKSIQAFFQAKEQHLMKEEPALHPILAALTIVLKRGEDLSLIAPNHPDLLMHNFPGSPFFLPSREDRWWEDIVAKSLQAHMPEIPVSPAGSEEGLAAPDGPAVSGELPVAPEKFAASDELPAAPEELQRQMSCRQHQRSLQRQMSCRQHQLNCQRRVTEDQVPSSKTTAQSTWQSDNNVEMKEVGEPVKDKCLLDHPPAPSEAKGCRCACRRQVIKACRSGLATTGQPALPKSSLRCAEKGLVCKTSPTRPCDRCQADKAKCSLVPNDPITGKPIWAQLSESFVLLFRLEQLQKEGGESWWGRGTCGVGVQAITLKRA